jgi:hypothetical protein
MLGIGEVWYFREKEGVFSRNDNSIMVLDQRHVLVVINTNWSMMLRIDEVWCFIKKVFFRRLMIPWWNLINNTLGWRDGHMKKNKFMCVCRRMKGQKSSFWEVRSFSTNETSRDSEDGPSRFCVIADSSDSVWGPWGSIRLVGFFDILRCVYQVYQSWRYSRFGLERVNLEDWGFGREKTQMQWSILQDSVPKPGFWASRNEGHGSHLKIRESMKDYKMPYSDAYLVATDLRINRVCVALKGCQWTSKVEYRDGTGQDFWRPVQVPVWIGSTGPHRPVYR